MAPEDLPIEARAKRVTDLVLSAFGGKVPEFKPVIFFDPGALRRIVVLLRDCSVCHKGYPVLSIYEDNHPTDGQDRIVGFEIRHAPLFAQQLGLPLERLRIADLLDALSAHVPEESREDIVIARRILEQFPDPTVSLCS